MNKLRGLIAVAMILVLTMVSCSKDSDGNAVPTKMGATINDKSWSTATRVTVLSVTGFTITGTSLLGESLAITIKGATAGTYNLSPNLGSLSGECLCVYSTSMLPSANYYTSTEGTVNLTEVDSTNKTISGSFSFTAYNLTLGTIAITNGTFSKLSYTEQGLN